MKILGITIWPRKKATALSPESGLLRGPHCDPDVLHIDGCDACEDDAYVEAKAERIHKGINFTGSSIPGRSPCPAEARRPLESIYAWSGNRPYQREAVS